MPGWKMVWEAIQSGGYPLVILMQTIGTFSLALALIYRERWTIPEKEKRIAEAHALREAQLKECRDECLTRLAKKDDLIHNLHKARLEDRDKIVSELLEKSKNDAEATTKLTMAMERVDMTLQVVKARLPNG